MTLSRVLPPRTKKRGKGKERKKTRASPSPLLSIPLPPGARFGFLPAARGSPCGGEAPWPFLMPTLFTRIGIEEVLVPVSISIAIPCQSRIRSLYTRVS
ncbi:hypothetical protein EVAR_6106_1 [Eumeta japonica]|uniref:Uncharacterized protein n=1 Tax=Eumeta variegata TaxID=151549 RepID=A0A4C1TEZ9_EUMVA|nr:hypothetical protein EVAR_6106_1 [Eumeta japonica]